MSRAQLEVRRSVGLSALIALGCLVVTGLYGMRAVQDGGVIPAVVAVVFGLLTVLWGIALADARSPLLAVDRQGVRLRFGNQWVGLPWGLTQGVEFEPGFGRPSFPLTDGTLTPLVHEENVLGLLGRRGRWHARLTRLLYGTPFAVPLGLSTRVLGTGGDDLDTALARLIGDDLTVDVEPPLPSQQPLTSDDFPEPPVVVPRYDGESDVPLPRRVPGHSALGGGPIDETAPSQQPTSDALVTSSRLPDPRPWMASGITRLSQVGRRDVTAWEDTRPVPVVLAATEGATALALTPELDPSAASASALPELAELTRQDDSLDELADLDATREVFGAARQLESSAQTEVIERPLHHPVGALVLAARRRAGLELDQVAQRSGIPAPVIAAIEADDFAPCGGDFYVHGQLRTLGRVLGFDPSPLLASYDEQYARAEMDAVRLYVPTTDPELQRRARLVRIGLAASAAGVLGWAILRAGGLG